MQTRVVKRLIRFPKRDLFLRVRNLEIVLTFHKIEVAGGELLEIKVNEVLVAAEIGDLYKQMLVRVDYPVDTAVSVINVALAASIVS